MAHRSAVRSFIALVLCAPLLGACVHQGGPAADTQRPLGSLKNARVAMQTDDGQQELTYLAGPMSDERLAELRALAPNVRIISRDDAIAYADEAHGIDGRYCSPEFLQAADKLVWVQSLSAGVERYLSVDELRASDQVVLTNMQGVHGPAIAEHAFAMLLALTRGLPFYLHPDQRGGWTRSSDDWELTTLHDRTLFVVGLGGIGREVAKRGHGFEMRVVATRRSRAEPPPYVDYQGTPDELYELLAEADVVAICLPLTDETEGLFDERAFDAMKPGSYLINVGRGKIVDTDALVAALESGKLAGACLDVTDPEPLPPEHVLWTMADVIITPHMSSRSALTSDRWWALYKENMRRFGAGEQLLNVVDKQAGY